MFSLPSLHASSGGHAPPRAGRKYTGRRDAAIVRLARFKNGAPNSRFTRSDGSSFKDLILAAELIIQALSARLHSEARRTVLTHGPEAAVTALATDKRGGGSDFHLGWMVISFPIACADKQMTGGQASKQTDKWLW
jgi:hypothetical protein